MWTMEYAESSNLSSRAATADVFGQVWTAGQVIGLIHDIPSCEELVKRIEREAEETLNKASSLIIGNDQVSKSASGTVGENMNSPGAEIWGVGKSKL